ncbi:uncharacterized protein LOC122825527 isoform X4 [Gambusia affinis]|uniref:uncharacterized protein LOC122825527 isoform X4 n=1 Tax=Gambusia affinis TaxID=33528 RepID=UPI001CDC9466|nr:uncharacterized protein LOC122825527 isoform X4 [Gambusia affinis]
MLSFKWISKTLFTILMLQLTATAGQQKAFFTVKAGDGVTLPCGNVGQTKHNCDRITWTSIQPGNGKVSLFERGDFTEEANVKSGRLSVTADCSLVIENVTVEDFGHYSCRQNNVKQVDLSVVTMTEQRNNGKVTFTCSVSQFTYCRHQVLWLYEGKEKISPDMNVSSSCSATVTIPAFHLDQNSKFYELLKCRVQDGYDAKQILLFTFSHQSSGQERGWVWWPVIVSMLLAGLLITVMVTIGWIKTKGNKKQKDDQPVDPYASYASMNLGMETRTKSNVSDAVIYSTLQPPSAVI